MQNNTILVGICDDEVATLAKLKAVLIDGFSNSDTRCEFHTFPDPKDLIAAKEEFDILLLDVNMPGMNGFEVAAYLRAQGSKIRIIFFTVRDDLVQKGFEVRAFRYLYKGCTAAELIAAVKAAVQDLRNQELVILRHPASKEEHFVSIMDILYIESLGQGSAAHTLDGYYLSQWQLRQWHTQFPILLGRPHQTYLINFAWVKSYGKNTVMLKNGVTIPISARNKGKTHAALKEYVHHYGIEV